MAKSSADFVFNKANPHAVRAAKKRAARMVVEISKETERNIRNLISAAIRKGMSAQDAAREIRSMVGLTAAQGQAVLSYRQELLASGLTRPALDKAVEEYSDKLLRDRADNIARTEIMDSLTAGQEESWRQAQEEGFLSDRATKEWLTTPDSRLCSYCEAMDGKQVLLNEEFEDGGPPLHPSCRCTIAIGVP